jgi:hypothetical protein
MGHGKTHLRQCSRLGGAFSVSKVIKHAPVKPAQDVAHKVERTIIDRRHESPRHLFPMGKRRSNQCPTRCLLVKPDLPKAVVSKHRYGPDAAEMF